MVRQIILAIRNVVRKKLEYVGQISKGGGVWPKPTPYFSLFFPIQGLIIKAVKNVEIPKLGEGGLPLGNFSHIIPFFSGVKKPNQL